MLTGLIYQQPDLLTWYIPVIPIAVAHSRACRVVQFVAARAGCSIAMKKFRSTSARIESLDPVAEVPQKEILARASLWMLVFCLILSIGFVRLYRADTGNQTALRLASAWQSVNLSAQLISDEISDAFSDIGYLASQNELSELLNGGGFEAGERLGTEYLNFLMNKRVYDQLRYIGADGVEVVRANFNNGKPALVPPDGLQDKSGRYYFKQVMELEPGQMYLSLFDLNLEYSKMETPIKPVVRIGTPVSDTTGRKRGMVVLNYLGSYLIDKISAVGETSGVTTWLIDAEGYWLKGPERNVEWGFMYKERQDSTLERYDPQAWQRMSASDKGQFYSDGDLFVFAKLYPELMATQTVISAITAPEDYHLTVIATVAKDLLMADRFDIAQRLFILFGIILSFLIPVSWLLARLSVRKKALNTAMINVLDHVPVLISYVDAEQRLRFNNAAYGRFFGLDPVQLNGSALVSVMGEDGYKNLRPYIERVLDGKQVNFQTRITFRQAGTRVIDATYVPDFNNDGSVRGFFGVISDITELHEAQERVRQRLIELAHAQRINIMGEMATEIAHEINQPLTTIVNFSTACVRSFDSGHRDDEQIVVWITAIRDHAKRASEVVHRLRTFLKKGETEYEQTDINLLIRDVVGWMDGETHSLKITISLDLKPDLPNVMADDILLAQVILNLVRNAIEALSEKQEGNRELIIKSSVCDSGIQVAVSDNGPGISEDIDDQIFYSFITSKKQGLGMGLSVSRSIVEAHGGSLRVDPNATTMTTFVITLPSTSEFKHA